MYHRYRYTWVFFNTSYRILYSTNHFTGETTYARATRLIAHYTHAQRTTSAPLRACSRLSSLQCQVAARRVATKVRSTLSSPWDQHVLPPPPPAANQHVLPPPPPRADEHMLRRRRLLTSTCCCGMFNLSLLPSPSPPDFTIRATARWVASARKRARPCVRALTCCSFAAPVRRCVCVCVCCVSLR